MFTPHRIPNLLLLILAVTCAACQQRQAFQVNAQPSESVAESQHKFIQQYLDAIRSNDPAKLKKHIHPKLLACFNAENREYLDLVLSTQIDPNLPDHVDATEITPLKEAPSYGFPPGTYSYPVQPTHHFQIQLSYKPAPKCPSPVESESSPTVVAGEIASMNGSWYLVFPCPTGQGARWYHDQDRANEEQLARASKLAGELRDPLLSRIKQLIKERCTSDAEKEYQTATGADPATALRVIYVLGHKQIGSK